MFGEGLEDLVLLLLVEVEESDEAAEVVIGLGFDFGSAGFGREGSLGYGGSRRAAGCTVFVGETSGPGR